MQRRVTGSEVVTNRDRSVRRMVAAVLTVVAAMALAGCGVQGSTAGDGPPGSAATGPAGQDVTYPEGVLPDRLGFLDVTGDEIRDAVAPYDGEIEIDPEGLRILQVRFPVDDLEDLLEIRDALQAQGYRVEVVPATDPGIDGDGGGILDVEP